MQIEFDAPTMGQWGDTFGGLNALMSTLAFVAVFHTIRVQQREIRETQRDQHIQRFESTYFEILKLFREARDAFKFRYTSDYVQKKKKQSGEGARSILASASDNTLSSGLDAIRRANFEILWWLRRTNWAQSNSSAVVHIYEKVLLSRYESTSGPYFRLLYTVLSRIKEDTHLTASEKRLYANLFRSQLSSHEVALVGFNGLHPVSKDLARLITEFRLLKYLPPEFGRDHLSKFYPAEAFEDRPD
jgi:hypothetical protein